MDSDQGKLFIGGISWETSEEKLREYFNKYGEVVQTVIMTDKMTGRPRGFGFVVFADPGILDRVLQDKHTIDGRTVEAKRALSREEQQTSTRSVNPNAGKNFASGGNIRTKKIFVGGLPPTLTEEGFRQYFENYGTVTDVVVMYDQSTQRPRGFGFISFDTEDAVDRVLHKSFHDLNGKLVEVKRALPKDANPGGGGRTMGSGGYQGYGNSGGNTSTYDSRMEANRYIQPQAAGGGYPTYGSSGYGAPGYGYGAANNPVSFGGGYSGYSVGGYGSANAAYGAPAGAYGNPNAPNAGYVSGPPGAPRSPWNNQAPSGYGSAGYGGNTGYGAAGWSATGMGSGGTGSTPTGQSPSATAGYGNQGYGYGGSEGSYANVNSYGAVGGRAAGAPNSNVGGSGADQQGASAGYMGGGYGDTNGNSGYPNSGWRADPSQGGGYGAAQTNGPPSGQVGYGGGYGSAASRQAQQQ